MDTGVYYNKKKFQSYICNWVHYHIDVSIPFPIISYPNIHTIAPPQYLDKPTINAYTVITKCK